MIARDESLQNEVQRLQAINQELVQQIRSLQRQNQALQERLRRLLHRLFGRRSEKADPHQLLLLLEQEDQADRPQLVVPAHVHEAPDAEEPPRRSQRVQAQHPGRAPLPPDLPRERIEIHPDDLSCPCCREPMRPIGEDITEELGRQPARFYVRQYVRVKYACPRCQEGVRRPALPPRTLEKAKAGPDVIAHVLVSKYGDHLPLHRQGQIYRREGVPLDRRTLCEWVAQASWHLRPLVEQMRQDLWRSHVIQSDDTPVRYLDPTARGAAQRGYLWVYVSDQQDVLYDFRISRSRAGPTAYLAGYAGLLQVDGYAGYNEVLERPGMQQVACWAHVRRKFVEARESEPQHAAAALLSIRGLYLIEAEARERQLDPPATAAWRQQEAVPLLADLEQYLRELAREALPKSPLGQAVSYALERWAALCVYANDGQVAIDNNGAERAIRRVAVGRKNWLFAGSPAGGERAAILYSLIETCSRHGIDPQAYLTDVLRRLCTHPQHRISELTPRGWLRARQPDHQEAQA